MSLIDVLGTSFTVTAKGCQQKYSELLGEFRKENVSMAGRSGSVDNCDEMRKMAEKLLELEENGRRTRAEVSVTEIANRRGKEMRHGFGVMNFRGSEREGERERHGYPPGQRDTQRDTLQPDDTHPGDDPSGTESVSAGSVGSPTVTWAEKRDLMQALVDMQNRFHRKKQKVDFTPAALAWKREKLDLQLKYELEWKKEKHRMELKMKYDLEIKKLEMARGRGGD